MEVNRIILGDCLASLKTLPDNSIDCCVTSPPYYALRDYGCDGQIGLEETPEAYIAKLTEVFSEVRRVLKPDGTLWLNIGDSYWGGAGVTRPFQVRVATSKKAVSALIVEVQCLLAKKRMGHISRKTLSVFRGCSLSPCVPQGGTYGRI